MVIGYNTNGMAHHDLFEAVRLLDEIGYRSVAITIDHGALSPWDRSVQASLDSMRELLDELDMRSVIETGARFLLNPRVKHEPTLVSPDPRDRCWRIEFYRHAIDCAAKLRSDCVSLWSGIVRDEASDDEAMSRLVEGLKEVLEYATEHRVTLGFEPEPGMLIDSTPRFEELFDRVASPNLALTLDVGHWHCQDERPLSEILEKHGARLVNVHIEDMCRGVHEHLMFGDGEIAFPEVLRDLAASGYDGGLHVELSRHAHEAPTAARRAFEFLAPLIPQSTE